MFSFHRFADGQRRLDGGQDPLHDHQGLVHGQARRPGLAVSFCRFGEPTKIFFEINDDSLQGATIER